MTTKEETRSLERALQILEVLAQCGPCSLHQLHERTALSKSTIRRLLATLCRHHFVRRGICDRLYRANITLPWDGDRELAARTARLVEVATPHLSELTKNIGWPSDLFIYWTGRIRLVESTRSISPFDMDKKKFVDRDINMFMSAAGLAYLSALEDSQVSAIVRANRDEPEWCLERLGLVERDLLRELKHIRKAGYAVRRPGYRRRPASATFNAVAVPIADARGPIGGVSIWWPRKHLNAEQFARKYLFELRATAARISDDLARLP